MIPSKQCLEFIKYEEGSVLHSYKDSAGIWTIGIGSTLHKDGSSVKEGETITEEEALSLLQWEVNNKARHVSSFLQGVELNQNQYDALISFAYNVGTGAEGLRGSTLLKKVKANPSDPSIRDEFLKWNKIHVNGVLKESAGLTARRRKEAYLYFS